MSASDRDSAQDTTGQPGPQWLPERLQGRVSEQEQARQTEEAQQPDDIRDGGQDYRSGQGWVDSQTLDGQGAKAVIFIRTRRSARLYRVRCIMDMGPCLL